MKWDDYFMAMAEAASLRSKDPSTKVGAVIVNSGNVVMATGYNGPPRGTCDDMTDRKRKLLRVIHAEENAILFARTDLRGCTMYVTHHPCCHCAAVIVQAGITRVVHPVTHPDLFDRWHEQFNEARLLFRTVKVQHIEVAS